MNITDTSAPDNFAVMTDMVPVMIWKTDAKGQYTYFNQTWLHFTGKTSSQELAHGWLAGIHPEDRGKCITAYEDAFANQSPFTTQFRLRRFDGTYAWIMSSGTPLFDDHQSYVGHVGSCTDITEQKVAENQSERYKERLEIAQEAGEIGTFEWDMKTNDVWFSEQEIQLLDIDPDPVTHNLSRLQKSTYVPDIAAVQEAIREASLAHQKFDHEFRIKTRDGSVRWMRGKGKFFYNKKGEPIRMVGINYDITERKLLEETQSFKAKASRILSSSLDYEKTLRAVANLAVEYVADWCSIDMIQEDGTIEQVILSHKDPKKLAWAKKLQLSQQLHIHEESAVAKVIREGKSLFVPSISHTMFDTPVKKNQNFQLPHRMELSSLIIVPIKMKDHTIGSITYVSAQSRHHYLPANLELAEQLASRAAMAIENSTLYEQVRSERMRLQKIVANVTGVVWETEGKPGNERTTFVSQYAEKMLGFPLSDWYNIPQFWHTIVHPDDQKSAAQQQKRIFELQKKGINRYRWVTKKGTTLWIESHLSVIKNEKGESIGMRAASMNVTERIEQERKKDEFISMASHELKTPLTSIKLFNQVLLQNKDVTKNVKAALYLRRMNRQMDRLTKLVTDLLDVSKIQSGKLQLHKTEFSLHWLIRETVDALQTTTDKHQIIFTSKLHIKLFADRDRIGQVLTNLLSNAIKYTPDGGEIVVTIKKDAHHHVCISVQDQGIGIPLDSQKKIFDRFYRVFDSMDQTFPGLGIGLYICSQIISRHDGTLSVTSNTGKGSRFTFCLPIR